MSTRATPSSAGSSGRSASRVAKRKMAQNRVKLGAAGVVALVLVGGLIAARAAGGDDS